MEDRYSVVSDKTVHIKSNPRSRFVSSDVGKQFLILDTTNPVTVVLKLDHIAESGQLTFSIKDAFEPDCIETQCVRHETYPSECYDGLFIVNPADPLRVWHFISMGNLTDDHISSLRLDLFQIVQAWALQPLKGEIEMVA
ncbi:hypothetical protein [Planktotalea sp.]|uniref:hypothetical protein n=1 Tax=Planktotalea sp. TaxID=2029877 RepID=UPI003298F2E8